MHTSDLRPHHRPTPLLTPRHRALRRHQVHLARQRHQRGLDLRHLAHLAVKTWSDILTKESHGGEGPGADPDVYTLLYKNVFGAKMKLVAGLSRHQRCHARMERGEVDGLCGFRSTMKARAPAMDDRKEAHVIIQAALRKQPELPVCRCQRSEPDRVKLQISSCSWRAQETARPFAAPPDIPADRKAALIRAFDATMKDPEFLCRAQKLNRTSTRSMPKGSMTFCRALPPPRRRCRKRPRRRLRSDGSTSQVRPCAGGTHTPQRREGPELSYRRRHDADGQNATRKPVIFGKFHWLHWRPPGVVADSNGLFHGLGDHAENSFSVDGQPITDQQSKVFSNQIPLDSISRSKLSPEGHQQSMAEKLAW